MGAARRLLAGAAWIYGAQIVTVVAQFAYAAVTSRLVGPSTFGAYAIALSVSGLVTLLVAGGMAQAVARMPDMESKPLHGLVTFAVLLGIGGAVFTWFTAGLWASLWGDASADSAVQFLALGPLVAPLIALSTTVMRRQGSYRRLATVTLVSNLAGMVVGLVAVAQTRSATALAVSAVTSQLILLVASLLFSNRALWGIGRLGNARHEVVFSANLTAVKVAEYLVGNIMKFSVSRWLGSAYFGHWNRADMLATLPFQQVQNAMLQAVSPEFRHDIETPSRAFRVWTDLLTLVAWLALPVSAVAAVVLPSLVPLLFGAGWDVAGTLTAPLAIAAGLQTISMVLSTAVESLGRFRWMWITSVSLVMFQVAGAFALLVGRNIGIAMAVLLITQLIRQLIQVIQCRNSGYLDTKRLLRNYAVAVAFSLLCAGIAALIKWCLVGAATQPLLLIAVALLLIIALVALWRNFHLLPPYVLAQRYGLASNRN